MYKTICVTNRRLVQGDFVGQLERIVQDGPMKPEALILREKDLGGKEYEALAVKVLGLCRRTGVSCYFNAHPELAAKLGADGTQLSFGDFAAMSERNPLDLPVTGVSVHSAEEAVQAQNMGASYIIYGHVFETDCHAGLPPRGLAALHGVCSLVTIPVFAIGGIDMQNARLCIEAGATGVCMMSGFMKA